LAAQSSTEVDACAAAYPLPSSICEICGLKISPLELSGIDVLFDVQHPKTPGLHIEESSENFAEIISVLVAARDRNFVNVHRSEQEQVLGVFHPGAMDSFRGIASVGLPIDSAKVIRVSAEFSRD
jgi:hypothetical protein